MLGIVVILVLAGTFLFMTAQEEKYEGEEEEGNRIAMYVVAIVCWVSGFIVFLVIVSLRKKILLATAVLKASSMFIGRV